MLTPHRKTFLLTVLSLLIFPAAAALAHPQAIALDGVRDPGYTLLAQDPANDLGQPGSWTGTRWADATNLYYAIENSTLYVYADLPNYSKTGSSGELGLAIDTTGDVANSGGGSDPWGNAITFAYTATYNNVSAQPVNATNVIKPDLLFKGNIPGLSGNPPDDNNGWTERRVWNGSTWSGNGVNWGGIASGQQVGSKIAYRDNNGVEFAIPFSDLGVSAGATLHLQFYTTQKYATKGAFDTVPSDDQSVTWDDPTTQRKLATLTLGSAGPTPTVGPTPTATLTPPPTQCASTSQGDGNILQSGLYHLDTDPAYRNPLGDIEIGSAATLKFRTCANDVQSVQVLVWLTGAPLNTPSFTYTMTVSGADPDYTTWVATVPAPSTATNQWYQFRLMDGATTNYYRPISGNTGLGQWQATLGNPSWKLGTSVPPPADYAVPTWLKDAVIYQIFPDRFRNGNNANNPGPRRVYGPATCNGGPCDWSLHSNWNDLPTQPSFGMDFFGGDLQGVIDQINAGYFNDLGVNTLYFNPLFDSSSNHGYDTNDYYNIAPRFGNNAKFDELIAAANAHNLRVVLDAVYNHTGSDSKYIDGYGLNRWPSDTGACEGASPYRTWFKAGSSGLGTCTNSWGWKGWYNYETIPELEENDAVKAFFYRGGSAQSQGGVSVTQYWLNKGIAGWRFDVAQDITHAWFQDLRPYVKNTYNSGAYSNTVLLGEVTGGCDWYLYQSYLNANELDSVMNYCFRDMAIGFANGGAPSSFDSTYNQFRALYPQSAFYAMMNLLDSHDATRALRLLNDDKQRLKLAVMLQMTLPGAPSVYYGDEVALTGGGDPDNRRTYPWLDFGGNPDTNMYSHFKTLIGLRNAHSALRGGILQTLLVSDADKLYSYYRADANEKVVVILNNGTTPRTATVNVAAFLPNGTQLIDVLNANTPYTVTNGNVVVNNLGGQWGNILVVNVAAIPPVVAFANAAYSVSEAAGNLALTLSLDHAITQTVSLTYTTVPGSASAGSDYTAISGTLSFSPNTTSRTLNLPILEDVADEPDETLTVLLGNAVNATLGTPLSATVTIVDNDGLTLAYSAPTYAWSESGDTALISVTLNTSPATTITVNFSASPGTATLADFGPISSTLTFAPGVATVSFPVVIFNDTLDEVNETVLLALSNPTGAALGLPADATLTIVDDDQPNLALSTANYAVNEGDGTVLIVASLDQPPALTVTVNFSTTHGSAGAGDYVGQSGTLTFAPGVTNRTLSLAITDDAAVEASETFTLTLTSPTNSILVAPSAATITIQDNDAVPQWKLWLPFVRRQ